MTRFKKSFHSTFWSFICIALFFGCGGGGSDTVATGGVAPGGTTTVETATFRLESVLARAVPSAVDRFRITGFGLTGAAQYGPVSRDKAPVVVCEGIPISVVRIQVEYLAGSNVVGVAMLPVQLRSGQIVTVSNPDIEDVDAVLESLTITPSTLTLAAGTEHRLTAVGRLTDGSVVDLSRSVLWASDSSAASVDSSGLLRGSSPGPCRVSATLGGVSASAVVTVTDAVPVTVSLTLEPSQIVKGTRSRAVCRASFSDGTIQDVTSQAVLSSSSTSVASIGSEGLVLGLTPGSVVIRARYSGLTNTATLVVTDAVLTGLRLAPSDLNLPKGTSATLTATGLFSDQTEQDLTLDVGWNSVDSDVVTVHRGLVQGLTIGTTTVVASLGDVSESVSVQVTPAVATGLRLSISKSIISLGETATVTATATFSDQTELVVNSQTDFDVSDEDIITVKSVGDNRGEVSGVGPGLGTVVGEFHGLRSEVQVEVLSGPPTLASVRVEPARAMSAPNTKRQYKAIGVLTDGSEVDLTNEVSWTSSNNTLVSVSNLDAEKGQVKILSQQTGRTYTISALHPDLSEASTAELVVNAFAYIGHSNNVATFAQDVATGALSYLSLESFGGHPAGLVVNSSGTIAYVASRDTNSVVAYSIDLQNGAFSYLPDSSRPTGTTPNHVSIDPLGRFLYVSCVATVGTNRGISAYTISPNGSIEAVPGSTFEGERQYIRTAIHPSGKYLFGIWYNSLQADDNGLRVFAIAPDSGSLSLLSGYPAGRTPSDVVVSPDGAFVYMSDLFDNNIAVFRVNAETGMLSEVAGSPFSTGDRCMKLVVHPNGRFLYSVDSTEQSIRQFAVDSETGTLAELANFSSYAPHSAHIDVTGRFFYVTSEHEADNLPNDVTCFRVDSETGALSHPVEIETGPAPHEMVTSP